MEELAIKRELNEETRRESVWCQMNGTIECFSLHITGKKEAILTHHTDYSKIYSIQALEFFQSLERSDNDIQLDCVKPYIQNYAKAAAAYIEAVSKCQVDSPNDGKIMETCLLEQFEDCRRSVKNLLRAVLDAEGFIDTKIIL